MNLPDAAAENWPTVSRLRDAVEPLLRERDE